jgi:hypothetical protein
MPEEDEERLTVPIRVNITPAEYAQLEALSKDQERSIAWLVRRAVRDYLMECQP